MNTYIFKMILFNETINTCESSGLPDDAIFTEKLAFIPDGEEGPVKNIWRYINSQRNIQ